MSQHKKGGFLMMLHDRVLAIIGGDEREQEIARLASYAGAEVRAYGLPWPENGVSGVILTAEAREALEGADCALFPLPGLGDDGSLFAPHAEAPIVPDTDLLSHLAPGAVIIAGAADDRLRRTSQEMGIELVEYGLDAEPTLLRGPAIVEGAVESIIRHTDVTIHGARVAIVGHGNIGSLLARTLVLLGGRVHVIARNPIQRAEAFVSGATPHEFADLPEVAETLDMLLSTVPSRVVDASILQRLPRGSLVMDLAAPPGGIDLDAAEDLGHRAVWARGLGRRAPVTIGRTQWAGILSHMRRLENT